MTGPPLSRSDGLGGATRALFLVLVLQLLAGPRVHLSVALPASHPGASPDRFAGGGGVPWTLRHGARMLRLHGALGLVIGRMRPGHLVRALRAPGPAARAWSTATLFGMVAAARDGASCLNHGRDVRSMPASVGFAIAPVDDGMLVARPEVHADASATAA